MKNESYSFFNVWVFVALMGCGLALYFVPLHSTSFCFDDHNAIENDEAIRTIDIPNIFHIFNSRFLVGLSFAINYNWCGLYAPGFRVINLLIHCFNAFLVYLLVKSTLRLNGDVYQLKLIGRRPHLMDWPAVFASLLFLCHPIATEPVNFITQRFVLMGSFLYLASIYFYVRHCERSEAIPTRMTNYVEIASLPTVARNDGTTKLYYFCSMIMAVAAMFCKEFVVTLPLMLGLYDFYFLNSVGESWWPRCRRLLPFFIIVLIVPVQLLKTPSDSIGVAHIAATQKIGNYSDITRAGHSIGRKSYFLTELKVVCTYVRLMFLPIRQNFDYDYPISKQVDKSTLLAATFLIGLLAVAWLTYKTQRMISFGIVWFFIALSVESSFIPIGHVIAEYRVYLASVGFTFFVTALIYRQSSQTKQSNIIAAIILACFAILTFHRNTVWKDELTLWNDTVHKSPHKARAYIGRGSAYIAQGKYKKALIDFKTAVAIDPKTKYALSNLAASYLQEGHLKEALGLYNRAIDNDPTELKAYFGRATTYGYLKEYDKARADVQKIKVLGTTLDYERICKILKGQLRPSSPLTK